MHFAMLRTNSRQITPFTCCAQTPSRGLGDHDAAIRVFDKLRKKKKTTWKLESVAAATSAWCRQTRLVTGRHFEMFVRSRTLKPPVALVLVTRAVETSAHDHAHDAQCGSVHALSSPRAELLKLFVVIN
jgi:hypothetical protein